MARQFTFTSDLPMTRQAWKKHAIALALIAAPFSVQAIPANMGTFNITSQNAAGTASGTYTAAKIDGSAGATGTFTITRSEMIGYQSGVIFTAGNNGIMIHNQAKQGTTADDRDKFSYVITLTPTDNSSIHTVKIGQTSYQTGGNSEIARQTLKYTPNTDINNSAQATVRENPNVDYFFGAMGDYFMGKKLAGNSFSSNNTVTLPQLRFDSSNGGDSGLYYYGITALNGSGNSNSFTPITNASGQVSFATGQKRGTLPPTPTFTNILKETSTNPNNQTTYPALNINDTIANNSSYVSYGIGNTDSNYVIAVKNAKTVTLTYEGIMKGNSGIEADVVGETYNEWISFGVESEPLYVFSGNVFNDNGGIDDSDTNVSNENATINSGIYNNANYFNGVFNPTPASPAEKGITGSTIRLVNDCTSPTIEYASQTLISTDASQIGKYEFIVLPNAISNSSSVCIIETSTNTNYPVRTTTDKRVINLTSNNFNYLNNNFGRVIAKNVALVLEKEQAVNDCNISSLVPSENNNSLTYSKSPLVDVPAGQCVAYKITATNRANLAINDFVMQDILQKAGTDSATVTSKLANPVNSASDYAADSVAIGNNGTVKTNTFSLNQRTKRNFYFNTKYGTTGSN